MIGLLASAAPVDTSIRSSLRTVVAISESTYALTDCCVGTLVSKSDAISSSSITNPIPATVLSDLTTASANLVCSASVNAFVSALDS